MPVPCQDAKLRHMLAGPKQARRKMERVPAAHSVFTVWKRAGDVLPDDAVMGTPNRLLIEDDVD